MTKSKYRTTNFSIIEYFSKNNFEPLNVDDIIEIFRKNNGRRRKRSKENK